MDLTYGGYVSIMVIAAVVAIAYSYPGRKHGWKRSTRDLYIVGIAIAEIARTGVELYAREKFGPVLDEYKWVLAHLVWPARLLPLMLVFAWAATGRALKIRRICKKAKEKEERK